MAKKNIQAPTGIDNFWFGTLDETDTVGGVIEHIEGFQSISVEMPQELVRAYGDNKTVQLAVSNGNIAVTSGFHKVPLDQKVLLLGLEKTTSGIVGFGSTDEPPYVACIFSKTYEDGSRDWIGLPKGMFTRPAVSGNTKSDSVEFTSEEITAEFMDREVTGFQEEKSVLLGYDAKGSTATRDAIWMAIFGVAYGTTTIPEGV